MLQQPTLLLFLEHLRLQPTWVLLLAAVGFFRAAEFCVFFIRWVYAAFLRPSKDLKGYGAWAVVTGPTDGIGKALAFELAGRGLNLVLVGRNPHKLRTVSDAIRASYPKTRAESVVLDFAGDTAGGIRRLRELAEVLDVGVVVNNAGVSFPGPLYFHEVEEAMWREMVRVNLVGPTEVTRAVLPAMLRRRRGAVVNVASGFGAALPAAPQYSVYAGTKAYLDVLSRSLYNEYKGSGVDVQCQVPFFVATKMIDGLLPKMYSFLASTPDSYAQATIHWIGYGSKCIPYWPHFLQWCMTCLVPEFIVDICILLINSQQRV